MSTGFSQFNKTFTCYRERLNQPPLIFSKHKMFNVEHKSPYLLRIITLKSRKPTCAKHNVCETLPYRETSKECSQIHGNVRSDPRSNSSFVLSKSVQTQLQCNSSLPKKCVTQTHFRT